MRLNTEKSKVVAFRAGSGREKKENWKWRDKKLEQVKEIKYLGYLQRNNKDVLHIKERIKKERYAMEER